MLELKNICKTFNPGTINAKSALNDLSLTLADGDFVTVIGGNGAGKSTMLNAIAGVFPVDSGSILIDGQDIQHVTLKSLREDIGIVQQEVYLFSGSVADNIAYGKPGATREEIIEAARLAGAERFIRALKDGFDTYVGERGVKLSGGQKQRIAIARVFLKNPPILILDEATAMLDPRGREQVMQTIHHLNKDLGITVVSITHYMEEAAQADRVLVMSQGNVVMEGTPKEVFSQTEKVRSLRLDVPQAAELRDELVKAGIPLPEGIIDTGECAQALYELLQ